MNDLATSAVICAKSVPPKARKTPQQNEAKATRVYVVTRPDESGCKIGISSNPKRRLSALQVSTPDKLSLFFQCRPDSQRAIDVEGAALELLRPWRSRGEWLFCEPQIAQLTIEAIVANDRRISNFVAALDSERKCMEDWENAAFVTPEMDRLGLYGKSQKEAIRVRREAMRERLMMPRNTLKAFPDLYSKLGRWT